MKQQQFIDQHQALWEDVDALLKHLGAGRKHPLPDHLTVAQFPQLYRQLCHQFALARQRHYSPWLIDRLHQLVIASHNYFYGVKAGWGRQLVALLLIEFPRQCRLHWRLFWLACAFFYLPGLLLGALSYSHDDMIYSIMSEQQVSQMEAMYDPQNKNLGRDSARASDTDFQMFGFYIFNNISIGFRTFASGLLLGVGSLVILLFNGVSIGSVAGYLTQLGYGETFWPFVSGHSAFELTAIVISGAAGLVLAAAIFAPGQQSRAQALVMAGRQSVVLVSGAGVMLLIAAFIEAFWSSSADVPNMIKYIVAALLWALVIWFLAFSGRAR